METTGTVTVKRGLAQMLKGGVIMDVVTPEHAAVAQEAGAVAVMALERIPADIRADGRRRAHERLELIRGIMDAVTIPVMAKVRIGHFAEAQVLQQLGVDYIDESEVLTPADDKYHVDKHDVHDAVRLRRARSRRSAAPDRRRRGDDSQQGRSRQRKHRRGRAPHARDRRRDSRADASCRKKSWSRARAISARRSSSCTQVAAEGKLPVVLFCAGGVSTPADAALMMQLGAEGIFVGSGIFKSKNPEGVRQSDRRRDDAFQRSRASCWRRAGRSALAKRCRASTCARLTESELLAPRGN